MTVPSGTRDPDGKPKSWIKLGLYDGWPTLACESCANFRAALPPVPDMPILSVGLCETQTNDYPPRRVVERCHPNDDRRSCSHYDLHPRWAAIFEAVRKMGFPNRREYVAMQERLDLPRV